MSRAPFGAAAVLCLGLAVTSCSSGKEGLVEDPGSMPDENRALCATRLTTIYKSLLLYRMDQDDWPGGSGTAFFLEPLALAAVHSPGAGFPETASCPGGVRIDDAKWDEMAAALAGGAPLAVDGTWSAYAGRDQARFPLGPNPSGQEAIVACDNDGVVCHAGGVNVLYADGSVRFLETIGRSAAGSVGPVRVGEDASGPPLDRLSTK